MASGSVFLLGGTGVDDGGKVGGATRGKDLELELENVTERNLPPLQDKSLSGKVFTALKIFDELFTSSIRLSMLRCFWRVKRIHLC